MRDLLAELNGGNKASVTSGYRNLLAEMEGGDIVWPKEKESKFAGALGKVKQVASDILAASGRAYEAESEMMVAGKPAATLIAGIPAAIAGGIAGLSSLARPTVLGINKSIPIGSPEFNKIIQAKRGEELTEASKIIESVASIPSKLMPPDSVMDAQIEESVHKAAAEPFKMIGRGLGSISEGITTGSLQKAVDVATGKSEGSNIFTPIFKIIGEADAIFAAGGMGRTVKARVNVVKNSSFYRGLTIKERGLVTQSLDDIVSKTGLSEAEAVRKFPNLFKEALEKRMQGEVKPAQATGAPRDLFAEQKALPAGQGFEMSEPKPKTILRKQTTWTEGTIPADLEVIYKTEKGAQKAISNQDLKETHEVTPTEGGYLITAKLERAELENQKMREALSITTEPEHLDFIISDMKTSLESGTPGGKQGTTLDGIDVYAGSGYPGWVGELVKKYSNKETAPILTKGEKAPGIDAAKIKTALTKGLNGDRLTPYQQAIWEDINRIADRERTKSYAEHIKAFELVKKGEGYADEITRITNESIGRYSPEEYKGILGNYEAVGRVGLAENGYSPEQIAQAEPLLKIIANEFQVRHGREVWKTEAPSGGEGKSFTPKLAEINKKQAEALKSEALLIAEARKYKSAEEFADSRITGYHGSKAGRDLIELKPSSGGELGRGVYFSRDYKVADSYGRPGSQESYGEKYATIPLDLGNLKFKRMTKQEFLDLRNTYFDEQQSILKKAGEEWSGKNFSEAVGKMESDIKKEGFDGIYTTDVKGIEQGVVFPSSTSKITTKSQLTDIWNKANSKKTEIPIIDEETYLTQHGASRQDIGESALHKNIPEGNIRKRLLENQAVKDRGLLEKRDQLREEYKQKVEVGEIRPPTRMEKLIATANGHPDNASVQAARRLLEGKGIDWNKANEGKGGGGTTLYSGIDPTMAVEMLRGLKNNIKEALPYLEDLGRSVYEGGKKSFLDWQAQMKAHLGDLWDSFKSKMREIWESVKKIIGNEKGAIGKDIGKGAKDITSDMGKTVDEYLGAISTRLGNIDPSIKYNLRKFEYKRGTQATKRTNRVLPFLEKTKKMSKEDKAAFDLARKNGDAAELKRLVIKNGLGKEYHEQRLVLAELYKEAKEVGYDIGYRENYHPRVLKDTKGFLEYFYKQKDWPILQKAIREKEVELQRYLSEDEKAILINKMLRGYPSGQISLSKPGQLKAREIERVTPKLNEFYMDSDAALLHYINDVTDAIEARRWFGVEKNKSKVVNLEDTIGGYVVRLLEEGKIKPEQEQVLKEILDARFNEVGTRGVFSLYKNMSYIDTMGSPISAITQIGDLAWALYKNGIVKTLVSAGKSIIGKSQFRKEDLGIKRIAEEFADQSKMAKAVDKIFKWIGLTKIDNIGKESLINSSYVAARKKVQTPKGTEDLRRELEPIFESETDQLIADFRAGKITENVKLYLFNVLSDFQPISLSEMPQKYLTGGNGRIFYMLKTFTLKQFDAFRREAFQKIATSGQRIQGIKNLIHLATCFVVANATADEIKDFLLGRKTKFSDRVVDNLLRLAGISKFVTWQARREGVRSAIVKQIAPPFKIFDAIAKDIMTAGDEKGLETVQSIPLVGKLYYWWFGKGAKKTEKKDQTGGRSETRDKIATLRKRITIKGE